MSFVHIGLQILALTAGGRYLLRLIRDKGSPLLKFLNIPKNLKAILMKHNITSFRHIAFKQIRMICVNGQGHPLIPLTKDNYD